MACRPLVLCGPGALGQGRGLALFFDGGLMRFEHESPVQPARFTSGPSAALCGSCMRRKLSGADSSHIAGNMGDFGRFCSRHSWATGTRSRLAGTDEPLINQHLVMCVPVFPLFPCKNRYVRDRAAGFVDSACQQSLTKRIIDAICALIGWCSRRCIHAVAASRMPITNARLTA